MDADAAGLEDLYQRLYTRFVAVAASIAGLDVAHDVVQDAFVRGLRSSRTFRGGSLERWMWRIVVNVARDAAARRTSAPLDGAAGVAALDAHRDEDLIAAIRALPPRRRSVVFLRHVADLPIAQIAELLAISPGTVSATLAQARASLRATVEEGAP